MKKSEKEAGLRTAVLIGGADIRHQIRSLSSNPHVIIGTPGRINDLLTRKSLKLSEVKILVLDEADRMLDMGFAPQIKRIMEVVPSDRQTMLFSATMPPEIHKIASAYLSGPEHVEVARAGTLAHGIEQEVQVVAVGTRVEELERALKKTLAPRWSLSEPSTPQRNFHSSCDTADFMPPKFTQIAHFRSAARRWMDSSLGGTRSWSQLTLPHAESMCQISAWLLILIYRKAPKITCTASAAPVELAKAARRSFALPNQRHLVAAIERLVNTSIKLTGVEFSRHEKPASSRGGHFSSKNGERPTVVFTELPRVKK